jgi:hypothetical protein
VIFECVLTSAKAGDHKFEASLGYIARPCLKKQQKKIFKTLKLENDKCWQECRLKEPV